MRTNKTALILIILLIIFAFVSVFVVLYDINNKNKEDILFSVVKSNSQYVFDASNMDILCNTFNSKSFEGIVSKNIKNVDVIKSNIQKIQSDSALYARIKDNRSLLATYSTGEWILLIKTNINIKVNIQGYQGNFGNYHYISSSKFEKGYLNIVHNQYLSHIINSIANTSDFHIIEAAKLDDEQAWICHDFYFRENSMEILSLYCPAKKLNNDISSNYSTIIKSLASSKKSYLYTYQNNSAVSVFKADYLGNVADGGTSQVVDDNLSTPEDNTKPAGNQGAVTIIPDKPDTSTDPLALFATNSEIIAGPYYLNNHTNQQGNIIIQDSENILYFLTTTGSVKWKFNADSKILGDITEVDAYNNNKVQYIFNTASRMYLITILGDNVKGFPLKLPVNSQNQILLDFTDIDNFNLIYAGVDNNAYILKYNKSDLRLHAKIENIAKTTDMFNVVGSGKNQNFIAKGSDNTYTIYSLTGANVFTIDKSFTAGQNPTFFENKTNSKGAYICNDNQGRLSYISKNKPAQYTDFGEFGNENHFSYIDLTGDGDRDFVFADKNKITAYDKFKNVIFDDNINLSTIDVIECESFKNLVKFVVFSQKDKKAIVFTYNYQTKKLSKNTYSTTTCPDVTISNNLIVEKNHLYLK